MSWLKAALKAFQAFPQAVREQMAFALEIAAAGSMADIAKPMRGFDGGVFEIAIPYRSDAFRLVYAVRIGTDLWVLHAFQKKSTRGIATPRKEIDLVHERLKRLREALE